MGVGKAFANDIHPHAVQTLNPGGSEFRHSKRAQVGIIFVY